jgi:hypothetical protein
MYLLQLSRNMLAENFLIVEIVNKDKSGPKNPDVLHPDFLYS